MKYRPRWLFFDTNIYIIGAATDNTPEAQILDWAGFGGEVAARDERVEVVLSEALVEQITRVARRLQGKDWAGAILAAIWQGMNVRFVVLDSDTAQKLAEEGAIPREDVTIYLSAKTGQADCFVSANHRLIRILAEQTGEFRCFTPSEFITEVMVEA